MLNEIKELEQYTNKLIVKSKVTSRIKYSVFCKGTDFEGIKRIFSIIARYYIFTMGYDENVVKSILASYCGVLYSEIDSKTKKPKFDLSQIDDDEIKDEIIRLEGMFPKIFDHIKPVSDSNKVYKDHTIMLKQKFEDKAKCFNYSNPLSHSTVNSYTSFVKAIANAKLLGPLKNYYLCIKKDSFDEIYRDCLAEQFNSIYSAKTRLEVFDRLFKTLGCYYISRNGYDNTLINHAALKNYYFAGELNNGYLSKNREYQFFNYYAPNGNILISPNDDLKRLNTEIVDQVSFENNHSPYLDYYVLCDKAGTSDILSFCEVSKAGALKEIDLTEYINSFDPKKQKKKKQSKSDRQAEIEKAKQRAKQKAKQKATEK